MVELMLGEVVAGLGRREQSAATPVKGSGQGARVEARQLGDDRRLRDATLELYPGEVLGVVALEGQGQDELFDILAGAERPASGSLLVDGKPVSLRHPADAIRIGMVYVAADRAEALLMQRSVRENISLPFSARGSAWGWINPGREGRQGAQADEAALLRAAHNLKPGAELPEEVVAATSVEMAAVQAAIDQASGSASRQA